ncbi:BTAD domain-containing putative transcriptional regulator [Nonomuraea fuscirosea]|uniref:BTAD domain-containing putative transcriptional regulator n=1 Tax=Nonomuraea fuscirosea TaxID=1291556 RepID=UPI00371C76E3
MPTQLPPLLRRMVAALLAAGPRGLTPPELAGAVWGDSHSRENSLKSAASKLRSVLGDRLPAGGAAGYRIQLADGDEYDVDVFRHLVEDAGVLRERGDLRGAAAALQDALGLWGSPPLPELPEHPALLGGVRRGLLAEHLSALVAWYEARLELGEHQPVAAELRREVAEQPNAEPLWQMLMTALYRGGARGEALRAYETLAAHLAAAGGEPGALVRQLRDEIAASSPPAGRGGVAGRPVPAQLPPDTPDFTGRRSEVEKLTELLAGDGAAGGVPVVGISGLPGVGKSALAVHVAHRLRPFFPDGQLFAHLAGMSRPRDPGEVLGELLGALGVTGPEMPATGTERSALLRSLLAGRRVLLVLDDAASAQQVRPFVPGTPGCAVLVSSRSHLAGPGIKSVRVEPLPGEEAERLLGDIIGEERVSAEPDAAGQVLQVCGGLPLAVRIVAARLSAAPHWQLSYFAGRLADRAKVLDALTVDDMAVAASIALSYEALPAEAQAAYRLLALAGPGSFPAWLVAMLIGVDDAEQLMQTLLVRSLITAAGVDAAGQPRYRQHDLLREYSAARLAEHGGEREMAVHRLLMGWLELVDRASSRISHEPYYPPPDGLGMRGWAPAEARALIDADPVAWWQASITNVLGVIRLAAAEHRYHLAVGIALRTAPFLYRQSQGRDAADMWRTVMQAAGTARDARRTAEARHRVASLVSRQSDDDGLGLQRAVGMLDECVQVFSEVVERRGWARSLSLRAYCRYKKVVAGMRGPEALDLAGEDAEQGLHLARVMHDAYSEFTCLRVQGLIASQRGRHEQARHLCEEAVTIAHKFALATGERAYEAFATKALVKVLLAAGEHEQALDRARHGRVLAAAVGHQDGAARFAELAGDTLAAMGRAADAAAAHEEAAALYVETAAQERCRRKSAAAGQGLRATAQ